MQRESLNDALEHSRGISKNLVVPESQQSVALPFEVPAPSPIAIATERVLPSIQLDDKSSFRTAEIYDKRADRMLTAKLEAGQTALPEK